MAYDEHEVNNTFKFGVIYQKFGQVSYFNYLPLTLHVPFYLIYLSLVCPSLYVHVCVFLLRHQKRSYLETMRRRQLSRSFSVS